TCALPISCPGSSSYVVYVAFECCGDGVWFSAELGFQIVVPQHDDDHVQGGVAAQARLKVRAAIAVVAIRVVQVGGATAETFLYDGIFGAQEVLQSTGPAHVSWQSAVSFGGLAERVGVTEAQNREGGRVDDQGQ